MTQAGWTVLASRHVHRDRWVSLRADDCLTADGTPVAPYYVFEYPDWVHVVALDEADNLLLVRQYRHGWGGWSVEIPAGMMDAEDPSPLAAAARELLEETGCAAERMEVISITSPNPATHTNRIHTVLARGVRRVQAQSLDATEAIETEWVSLPEALRLARSGEFVTAIQLASLYAALIAAGKLNVAVAP